MAYRSSIDSSFEEIKRSPHHRRWRIFRRHAGRLCCNMVKSRLADTFFFMDRLMLELRAVLRLLFTYATHSFITKQENPNYYCPKIYMFNAFNECNRPKFLTRLNRVC